MKQKVVVVVREFDCGLLQIMFNEAVKTERKAWKRMGGPITISVLKVRHGVVDWAINLENWKKRGNTSFKLHQKEKPTKEVERIQRKVEKEFLKMLKELKPKTLKQASNKKLGEWVSKIFKFDVELCVFGWSLVAIDFVNNLLTNKLNKILAEKKKKKKLSKNTSVYFYALTKPLEETFASKQQKEALKLAILFKKKKLSEKKKNELTEKHWKKYLWIAFGWQGPALTKEFFKQEIKDLTKKNCEKMLKDTIKEKIELKKQVKEMKKELKLNKKEEFLFDLARKTVYLKGVRKEIMVLSYFLLDLLVKEVSRRTFVPVNDLRYLTPLELINWMKKGIQPKTSELKERRKLVVVKATAKGRKILTGNKAHAYWKKNVEEEKVSKKSNILKGQLASPGLAVGKVKIINSLEDAKDFKENEVLVSHATQPELVPIMKKASAIITEQGGMTCHAAIVSRELNKPCVVGVKNATKRLKNNDLIEVDATHARITIIK